MNKVILLGRLTRDPDLRYSQSGQPVCRYSLAVNRSYKREGEPDADFINIVAFAARAEFAGKYFRKGMMVAICGELRVSSFDDRDGNKRWTTDVIVTDQYFAESKASFESRSQGQAGNFAPSAPNGNYQNTRPQNQYSQNNAPQPFAPSAPAGGPEGFTPVDATLEGDADLPF